MSTSHVSTKLINKIQRDTNPLHIYEQNYGKLTDDEVNAELNKLKGQEGVKSKMEKNTKKMYHKVNKFTDFIRSKYGARSYSISKIMRKAKKYMDDYDLSDREFHLFKILYEQKLLRPKSALRDSSKSKIGDLLGSIIPYSIEKSSLDKLSSDDSKALLQIVHLARARKHLHARSVIQTKMYTDCAPNVLLSSFDNRLHNPQCYVNPIIVAMFFPKIEAFENRMLNSFLAGTIRDRKLGAPVRYRPDYEFFIDLTTDRNDLVCTNKSVMMDVLNRVHVQEGLRTIVHNMRSGRLFECDGDSFLTAIDQCRSTPFDNPHLLYVNDEGTILRRLLNVFSFRPTHVITSPVYNIQSSLGMPSMSSINQMSMIEVKLPFPGSNPLSRTSTRKTLMSGLEESQIFIENGVMIPKKQQIIYNRDVVIFYVNRRYHKLSNVNSAYVFNRLPLNMGGSEDINTYPVDYRFRERIADKTYFLRSVVAIETDPCNPNLITGSCTLVVKHDDYLDNNRYDDINNAQRVRCLLYKPSICTTMSDANLSAASVQNGVIRNQSRPFFRIPVNGTDAIQEGDDYPLSDNFDDIVSRYGTIFIYSRAPKRCPGDASCGDR